MQPEYPITFGKYLLLQRIAVGGMAEVFRAKLIGPKGFEKKLAIKRILPEYSQDDEFVQMFVDEARISSQLHHSHIVQVYDFGEVDHQFYLAMELIEGTNLKNLFFRCLKEHLTFPQHLIYFTVSKIASALDYAHHLKIEGQEDFLQLVHRDVSPQNVLISRRGEVKLTDFGIAKAAIKMTQTQPGKIQGKYSYMSPEQALGRSIDHRSDIFSLGIIFFELLSGKKVYGSADSVDRYNQATKAQIPRLSRVADNIPAQIDDLVMRMLSKDPKDRPATCEAIVSTLAPFLTGHQDDVMMKELGDITKNLFPPPPELKASDETSAQVWNESTNPRSNIRWKGSTLDAEKEAPAKEITIKESTITVWIQKKWKMMVGFVLIFGIALTSPLWLGLILPTDTTQDSEFAKEDLVFEEEDDEFEVIDKGPQEDLAKLEMELLTLENEIEAIEGQIQKSPPPKTTTTVAKKTPTEQVAETLPPGTCPNNMIKISGGSFPSGSELNDPLRQELLERKLETKKISTFCMDIYEYPNEKGQAPKTNVTFTQAKELCAQKGKRLCTEVEWERACKGPSQNNQQFPYGNSFDIHACNVRDHEMAQAGKKNLPTSGSFEKCISPEGIFDLSGSVHEWTSTSGILNSQHKMTKGGSYETFQYASRCSSIKEVEGETRATDIGLRCCK